MLAAAAAVGAAVLLLSHRREPAAGEPVDVPPPPPAKPTVVQSERPPTAVARVAGAGGSAARGSVRLIAREEGGVSIDYRLENLPPGKHVLAVRETGDCSTVKEAETVGEVGEVVANVMGRTRGRLGHERMSLGGGALDVLGRALVIHEGEAAGRVVACGVLESL